MTILYWKDLEILSRKVKAIGDVTITSSKTLSNTTESLQWQNLFGRDESPRAFIKAHNTQICEGKTADSLKSVSFLFLPPLQVFDSQVDVNQLRHFSSLCFVPSVWKRLKIPWVSENDPSTLVACSKSAKTFQTSKGGFAYQGHFSVPASVARQDLVIWIN